MTDNFNIDDFDKIDEVVKNALGNFSETPSTNLWTKMRWKLFKNDISNLFRFKKSVNPSMNPVKPVFKMAWFQVAAAAAATVAVVSTIVYFTASPKNNQDIANTDNNNKSITKTPDRPQDNNAIVTDNKNGNSSQDNIGNNPVTNNADNNNVNKPKQNTIVPAQKDSKYTDNSTPDINKNNNKNPDNGNQENQKDKNNLTDQLPGNTGSHPENNPVYNNSTDPLNNNPSVEKDKAGGKPVDTVVPSGSGTTERPDNNVENQAGDDNIADQGFETVPEEIIDSINNGQWPGDPQISNDEYQPIIPNAIRPNNDGKNDFFVISNIQYYPINTLLIFDRNGKIIFEKSDYQNDWGGEGYPGGSYYYIFTYKAKDGTDKMASGILYIVR